MTKDTHSVTESELIERARESVRDHVLPPDVQRRLRQARAEAVDQMEARDSSSIASWFSGGRWLVPAGGVAILMLALTFTQRNDQPEFPVWDENEFAAAVEMDMLDDIEFLAWMIEEAGEEILDDG